MGIQISGDSCKILEPTANIWTHVIETDFIKYCKYSYLSIEADFAQLSFAYYNVHVLMHWGHAVA
jgi:hypothetical protein